LVAKGKTFKGYRNNIKMCDMEAGKEKRKKAGRPAKTIKKEVRACIRFTKLEYYVIRQKAAKAGIKASAYIWEVAIND
jgi:hypothetical protein